LVPTWLRTEPQIAHDLPGRNLLPPFQLRLGFSPIHPDKNGIRAQLRSIAQEM
jgi:hypothetical protein